MIIRPTKLNYSIAQFSFLSGNECIEAAQTFTLGIIKKSGKMLTIFFVEDFFFHRRGPLSSKIYNYIGLSP